MDAVALGGGERLYTAMSEEHILTACVDVHDCTAGSTEVGGRIVTDVLLTLNTAADPDLGRTAAVRGTLTGAAAATPSSVLVISEADLITGPTRGKARKFLMRQRHRAQTARA